MKKMMSKKVLGVIALALVCVMAGTVFGMNRPAAQAETVVLTSPFTAAIAQVRDSVVGVNNYQIVNNYGNGGYDIYGFPWSYFGFGNGYGNGFGNGYGYSKPESSEEVKYGSGSGVVVEKEYVLTNYHVVDGAHSLKISVGDDQENLYDATNVRLRNISIAYNLPKSVLRGQNIFQSVKVGFSCTNVLMLYSKMRGLDPESIFATSTNAIGFEYGAAPTSRAYVFNVSFGF